MKKISQLPKATLGIVASFMKSSMYLIEQNQKWELRQHKWHSKYPDEPEDYQEALRMYKFIGLKATELNFSPTKASYRISNDDWQYTWYTIKEVAEEITKKKLPDINPKDAVELGKITIFSAEDWYLGCTESEK